MRLFWAVVTIAFLTVPAYAVDEEAQDMIKKRDTKELNEHYHSALGNIPSKNIKVDPWGTIRDRATEPAKSDDVKPKKPPK
jgi:hypothetical protein